MSLRLGEQLSGLQRVTWPPGKRSDVPLLFTKKGRRAQAGWREPLAMMAIEMEAPRAAGVPYASTVPKKRLRPTEAGNSPRPKPVSSCHQPQCSDPQARDWDREVQWCSPNPGGEERTRQKPVTPKLLPFTLQETCRGVSARASGQKLSLSLSFHGSDSKWKGSLYSWQWSLENTGSPEAKGSLVEMAPVY